MNTPWFCSLFSPSFWSLVQFFQLHSALSTILHWLFTDAGKAMKKMYLHNFNMTTVCCEGTRSKDRKESWSRRRTTSNSWNVSHKARQYGYPVHGILITKKRQTIFCHLFITNRFFRRKAGYGIRELRGRQHQWLEGWHCLDIRYHLWHIFVFNIQNDVKQYSF